MNPGRATLLLRLTRLAASSSLAALTGALLLTSAAPACSSSDASLFDADVPPQDAEPEAGPVDAQFIQEAGDDGGVCAPAPLNGFTPPATPPTTPSKSACSLTQLDGYYTACLQQPLNAATCDAFKQANAGCGTCLDTSESASAYGPVVWYNQRQYYTVNIAGCISVVENDSSKTGCGGTYEALLECRRASCEQCLSGSAANFQRFAACEKTAGTTICDSYYKAESAACKDLSTPGYPANVCIPPTGSTAKDAFMRVAPFFCGPADAG